MSKLKLTIELVPSTVWYQSVFKLCQLTKQPEKWQEIKKKLFFEEGRSCWICGREGVTLEAHEFWEYDEVAQIQHLTSIHHLCGLCHKIKHIGFWCHTSTGLQKLVAAGLSHAALIQHFCEVNHCSPEIFAIHEREAFKLFHKRSQVVWTQDFGKYDEDGTIAKFINRPTRAD